ncbi:hypothetical protein EGW08_014483 [Elysia chlorotica]|uniref:ETS domain-containing protein n=1 Tax=Elysia chlorotica TaxID=188477 RepID=A0A3S0ZFM4_ELYCH|nr:hypothetical protein EGW08_014483 [Elysia chlorotica]
MMTGASFPSTDNTLLHMNPVFGLSRTDSGFYSTGVHGSRNNSSSSCSSSSSTSSMDVDYEEAWGADMVEERNYTDLTSVRSICQGPELLTSIMNEDDEGSLHVLLSDSGAMKAEPLDDYPGFSMADFINNLDTSELDSDGYSSSTDNETPHYTQLEEPSSFNFFGSSPTMGAFPPLPVTPSDQAKLPVTSTLPNSLAHSSLDGYPDHSDQWIVAKENLPDFRKLQDPSAEEKEKPTPSRRRSVPSSPKEKKKTGRESESPTLSEKSLSDRKKPGRKKGQVSNVLHLWEFMRDLLKDPSRRGDIIEWISEKDGVFRVVNSAEVARLWGEKKKNKKEMTYEKMSRSLRYSRLEGYFSDLPKDKNYPKKLCFKFGPKSKDWF